VTKKKKKENTATLPLILIGIELFFLKHSPTTAPSLKQKIVYLAPFFLLVAVIGFSFINLHQTFENIMPQIVQKSQQTMQISRMQYLITEFRVVVTYLRLLLVPINQSIDYYYPLSQSFFEINTLISFFILVMLAGTAIALRKKFLIFFFGICWFYIFLAVESSVIPIIDVIFEHRIYLPSKGSVQPGIKWMNESIRMYPPLISYFYPVATTYLDQQKYEAALQIVQNAYNSNNSDPMINALLGRAYCSIGNLEQALYFFDRALQLDSSFSNVYHDKAFCLFRFGKLQESKDISLQFIKLKPEFADSYYFIGAAYEKEGDLDNAAYYYEQALLKAPQNSTLASKTKERLTKIHK